MKTILLVDDETQILKSLLRLFIDTDYDIFTAENGEEALKILETEAIDLIISDMRMPAMDGYQLLYKVKEKYPKVIRIILSGQADEEIVLKAIQKNIAKIYVFKPWDNDEFMNMVDQIFETEVIFESKDLMLLINNLENLPTIASSYQKIIKMIEDEIAINDISKEIERDQSISTQVLRIANSAYYQVKTGAVRQAVLFLGLQNIKNITLATSIISPVGISAEGKGQIEELWEHSFLTNKLLIYIFRSHLHKELPEIASSAGLLHNIGVVLMLNYLSEDYMLLMENAEIKGLNLLQSEQELFKLTHQEAGGYLLRCWGIPFPIVEAALFHHHPLDEKIINKELVVAVHIAQKYAWDIMEKQQLTEFYPEVFEKLGLDQQRFESDISEWKPNL